MRLSEYLGSDRALKDLSKLLKANQKAPTAEFHVVEAGPRGKLGRWWLKNTKPWIEVELEFDDSDKCDIDRDDVRCYIGKVGEFPVVSDCGETISALMIRKGWQWRTCVDFLIAHIRNSDLGDDVDVNPELRSYAIPERPLDKAIIAILSVVARVREDCDDEPTKERTP